MQSLCEPTTLFICAETTLGCTFLEEGLPSESNPRPTQGAAAWTALAQLRLVHQLPLFPDL